MPGGKRLVATVACGLSIAGAPAHAERLALVGADPELGRATVATLEPWGVSVIELEGETPGATMPDAADRARTLARIHRVHAVVWIAGSATSPALWIYDVATGRAVALRLEAAPPFDPPGAAAVALTVKTLLRYSQVAPVAERLAVPPRPRATFSLQARGGAGLRAGGRLEPRLGLAGFYRPARDLPIALALGVRAGTGVEIERDDFVGRHRDTVIAIGARADTGIGGRLRLVGALGFDLHIDSIDGTSLESSRSGETRRYNPAAEAGVELQLDIGLGASVALAAGGGYRFRRQRFLVGEEEVYDVPPAEAELALGLAVPIL